MLSLTLATGRLRNRSTVSELTFRVRRKILNPMLK
jgi:hypothetical protein